MARRAARKLSNEPVSTTPRSQAFLLHLKETALEKQPIETDLAIPVLLYSFVKAWLKHCRGQSTEVIEHGHASQEMRFFFLILQALVDKRYRIH